MVVATEFELYDDTTRRYRVVETGGRSGGGAGHALTLADRGRLLLPRAKRVRGDPGPVPVLTEHRAVLRSTLVTFCVALHREETVTLSLKTRVIDFLTFSNLPAFLYNYIYPHNHSLYIICLKTALILNHIMHFCRVKSR